MFPNGSSTAFYEFVKMTCYKGRAQARLLPVPAIHCRLVSVEWALLYDTLYGTWRFRRCRLDVWTTAIPSPMYVWWFKIFIKMKTCYWLTNNLLACTQFLFYRVVIAILPSHVICHRPLLYSIVREYLMLLSRRTLPVERPAACCKENRIWCLIRYK